MAERQSVTGIKTAGQLLRVYWQEGPRLAAFLLLGAVAIMTVALVLVDVLFTTWYNYFYDALQEYDWRSAYDLLAVFVFMASVAIVLAVYRYYVQSFLGLRWRRWLTAKIVTRWLEKRSYYYLEDFTDQTDNPDQRIQEDINLLVNITLSLMVGMLNAAVTITAFIMVLWTLSGVITLPLGRLGTLHLQGYLVWVAVIYAIAGTWFTLRIGRPLPGLNFEQQRREANFRFAAVDLRTHAEHVALYQGENQQRSSLLRIFDRVLENWYAIILRQKLLLWFTAGYNQVSVLLPLVVALPNYFKKVFKLGGLIQTLAAFGRIQDALSFIVNSYTTIAEWRAVVQRLLTFLNHMDTLDSEALVRNQFVFKRIPENRIIARDLTIVTPEGETLLEHLNAEFIHGRYYWIRGDSGIGKSTFVRAIAGIWPFGSGQISLPLDKKIMYLPQRSYMPLGTLREALLFPEGHFSVPRAELVELLQACDLPRLTEELNRTVAWSEHLSPGELQRIAFVRILLQKPDWVFLDESTSALDLAHEQSLYNLLKQRVPACSVISVGHRPSLEENHDVIIDFTPYICRDLVT